MFGLSRTGLLFWLGIPFLNMMSITWPAAQSILSHQTSPSEQGQLQGAINSLRGIAGLVGPGLFTYIFSKSIGPNALLPHPGTPFFGAATLLLLALILAQSSATHQPAS
jgi:MFS transporter, DHA1 family, tetracycline resistance protein